MTLPTRIYAETLTKGETSSGVWNAQRLTSTARAYVPEDDAQSAMLEQMREVLEWFEKQRLDAIARADAVNAPEDEEVRALCERVGYGAVMDAASRMWARKHLNGAFYIGGCIGDTSARAILKAMEATR